MRYLILSDIHSNEDALGAVLARVRRKRFDRVVVLGDFVGYGASPNQVIDRIRNLARDNSGAQLACSPWAGEAKAQRST